MVYDYVKNSLVGRQKLVPDYIIKSAIYISI